MRALSNTPLLTIVTNGECYDFRENRHDYEEDYPERGPKVLFKGAHGFPAGGASFIPIEGEGPGEIDEVIEILFQHVDSRWQDFAKAFAQFIDHFVIHCQVSLL